MIHFNVISFFFRVFTTFSLFCRLSNAIVHLSPTFNQFVCAHIKHVQVIENEQKAVDSDLEPAVRRARAGIYRVGREKNEQKRCAYKVVGTVVESSTREREEFRTKSYEISLAVKRLQMSFITYNGR
jgi:hypothetical protein